MNFSVLKYPIVNLAQFSKCWPSQACLTLRREIRHFGRSHSQNLSEIYFKRDIRIYQRGIITRNWLFLPSLPLRRCQSSGCVIQAQCTNLPYGALTITSHLHFIQFQICLWVFDFMLTKQYHSFLYSSCSQVKSLMTSWNWRVSLIGSVFRHPSSSLHCLAANDKNCNWMLWMAYRSICNLNKTLLKRIFISIFAKMADFFFQGQTALRRSAFIKVSQIYPGML